MHLIGTDPRSSPTSSVATRTRKVTTLRADLTVVRVIAPETRCLSSARAIRTIIAVEDGARIPEFGQAAFAAEGLSPSHCPWW